MTHYRCQPGAARPGYKPIFVFAAVLALVLTACSNKYDSDDNATDIFLEREEIPGSWQTKELGETWSEDDDGDDNELDGKESADQDAGAGEDGDSGQSSSGGGSPDSAKKTSGSAGGADGESGPGGKLSGTPRLPLREDELLDWVYLLKNEDIVRLVERGLDRNFALAQSWYRSEGLRHVARIEGSGLYPQISLSIGANRGQATTSAAPASATSASIGLQWEIDYLGRLAAERRAAVLRYQSAWQSHRQSQLKLAADIASAWYTLEELQRLAETESRSLENLQENLDILEQGFRNGITNSLDVLLARNDVAGQEAIVRERRFAVGEQSRVLQLLLGLYPDGRLRAPGVPGGSEWLQSMVVPPGMPSDLLRRRPDLNSAWYEVLAADFELAAASRNRFPKLTLSASYGGSSSSLSGLVDSGFGAWSLGLGLLQTIFDGGRKRAAFRKSKTDLALVEQSWLHRVYTVFAGVERILTQHHSLLTQIKHRRISLESSEEAYALALEQYSSGTTSYSTVLQAQRRVLLARTNLIRIEGALRRNRVELFLAIGGGWNQNEALTAPGRRPANAGEEAAAEGPESIATAGNGGATPISLAADPAPPSAAR